MTIRMTIEGHCLYCEELPSWLESPLHAVRRAVAESNGMYIVERAREPLLSRGVTRANGGLRPVIDYLARERGTQINWSQYSGFIHNLGEPISYGPGNCATPHLVDQIARSERLLVNYDSAYAKLPELLAEIIWAYPAANFAVVVVSTQSRRKLVDKLRGLHINCAVSDRTNHPRPEARVVVCSLQGAAHNNVELNHRHAVLFPIATDAIGIQCQDLLRTDNARFRIVGFHPYEKKLSPYERDLSVVAYGFDEISVPLRGYDAVPVETVWLPFHSPAVVSATEHVSALLRKAVWRHDARNLFIARRARALCSGNAGASATDFPDLVLPPTLTSPARVVVLTSTLVHAVELARWLDGWPILTDPHARSESLSPEQQARLTRATVDAESNPDCAIATLAGLTQLRPNDSSIVIWAGAGKVGPFLPADFLVRPSGSTHRLLLIDIQDHHHPLLREWTEQRRRAYRRAEWLDVGSDLMTHRIQQFLARRAGR